MYTGCGGSGNNTGVLSSIEWALLPTVAVTLSAEGALVWFTSKDKPEVTSRGGASLTESCSSRL